MDDLRTKMGGRVSLRRVSEGAEKHIGKHARIDSMSCEMPALQASFSVDSKHGRHNGEPEASCAGSGVLSGVECKKSRNESFDCMRLIAFCGVIFLHLNATVDMETNVLMGSINSVVRFAVPYFFALTGFFICRADPYGMGRGFRKEIVFVGCAVLAYLVASYFGVWHWQGIGTSTPAMQFFQSDWIPAFLKWNSFGFAYHLWFLFALLYGYAILILWRSCKFPIPLFAFLGMAMMVIRTYLYEFGGVEDPLSDPASSFVFLGFPSFAFGMILSYASKWISKIPSPVSLVIIVFGGWLSIWEALNYGLQEIYVGSLVMVLGLFSLCLRCPHPFSRVPVLWHIKALAVFGGMPAGIAYIVHLAVAQLLLTHYPIDPLAVDIDTLLIVWMECAIVSIVAGYIVSAVISIPKWVGKMVSDRRSN